MKKIAIIILSLTMVIMANAQEIENSYVNNKRNVTNEQETIFGNEFSVRGFMEINSSITEINGQTVAMMGGGVDVVFNHKLNVGFLGQGMIAEVQSPNLSADGFQNYIQFGYGGLKIEPVFNSNKKVHFSLPVLFAAGAIAESSFNFWNELEYDNSDYDHYDHQLYRTDAVFILEPGVNVELNLFKHARLAAGASYRFVNDVDITNLKNSDFEGLTGNISLRFGWF